jgi:hypothetical protein
MGRRGYVAGAMAALVLLVVPLGLVPFVLAPLSADEAQPTSRIDSVAGDPTVAAAMTCSEPADPAHDAPTEVVAARMCATDNGLARWYAPQDGLYADLRPLVELLGSLEPMPESTSEGRYFCPQDGGWGFDLRLALASGETVSVPGDTGGCSTVRIGDEDVVGSDEVLQLFLDGIAEQRTTSEPPALLDELALGCGSDTTFKEHVLSRIGDPRELVRAVSCSRRPGRVGDVGPWRDPVDAAADQVATLASDMRGHTRVDLGFDKDPCADQRWVDQDLVGQTRWGDVVVVRGVCDTYLLSDVSTVAPEDQEFWYPWLEAQRILEHLRR